MSDETPIDFGPLDPQRDARRFSSMVAAIADSTVAPNLWSAMVAQWRVALAMASLATLIAWLVVRPAALDTSRSALLTWAADPSTSNSAALLASLTEHR